MRRAFVLCLSAGLCLGGGSACQNKDRLAPVEFDADAAPIASDPESTLAPGWPAPARAQLDNGAILHWLTEPESADFRVRVLLPLAEHAEKLDAATTAVVSNALALEVERRVRRSGGEARIEHGPGRIELWAHGRDADAIKILQSLTSVLATKKPARILAQAQGRLTATHRDPDASARASAIMVSQLFGVPLASQIAEKGTIVATELSELERGWATLLDPRHAVILVHAARPPSEVSDALARLAGTWTAKGFGFGSGADDVLERLRARPDAPKRRTRILAEPKAPLTVVDTGSDSPPVVMIGRLIPTKTATDRAFARLTQRMMQERIDARVAIAGDTALFSIRVPLSKRNPAKSIEGTLEYLDRFVATEHQVERIRQAATLWLGARVVEASLDGEDWTGLWSESLDLADDEKNVASTLSVSARAMLNADVKELRKWQQTWLSPRSGKGGWLWVAAGLDETAKTEFKELTPLAPWTAAQP